MVGVVWSILLFWTSSNWIQVNLFKKHYAHRYRNTWWIIFFTFKGPRLPTILQTSIKPTKPNGCTQSCSDSNSNKKDPGWGVWITWISERTNQSNCCISQKVLYIYHLFYFYVYIYVQIQELQIWICCIVVLTVLVASTVS